MCQTLFFNKVASLWPQVFSFGFCEIFKNTFIYRTLLVAASVGMYHIIKSSCIINRELSLARIGFLIFFLIKAFTVWIFEIIFSKTYFAIF